MQPIGRQIDVNTYNLSDRKFGYREDDLNGNDENYINGELRINRDYINEADEFVSNEPIQLNNPIYFQQKPEARGGGFLQQEENQLANPDIYGEDENGQRQNENLLRTAPQQEFYFNTKIRNTGYWGKVKLRRGTWMVIVGLFATCIALTIISVFWAFWYHPAANIPLRVIGITLLVWSTFTVIFGLLSNWLMITDPVAKFFVGSPVRWTSWVMLGSSIAITIASILITIYYTYWHNRFVNTPMIIIAIVFYFFGGLAFIISFFYNLKLMMRDIKVAKYGPQAVESDSDDEEEKRRKKELAREEEARLYSLYVVKSVPANTQSSAPVDTSMTRMETATPLAATENASETGSRADLKKDFRKKVTQMKPRTLMNTSSSINYTPNQSLNNTVNSAN